MKWKQIVTVCLACCAVVLFACVRILLSCNCPAGLMAHWGFLWPFQAGCAEVYHQSFEPSPHNDGASYHVFSYTNEAAAASLFDWKAPDPDVYKFVPFRVYVDQLLDSIDVPEEWRPDYETCLYWQRQRTDRDELFVFWDSSANQLCFVEFYL